MVFIHVIVHIYIQMLDEMNLGLMLHICTPLLLIIMLSDPVIYTIQLNCY